MKNNKYLIIGLIVMAFVSTFLIYQGCAKSEGDNIKFSKEYTSVGEKNVFTYRTLDEIIKIMEKEPVLFI